MSDHDNRSGSDKCSTNFTDTRSRIENRDPKWINYRDHSHLYRYQIKVVRALLSSLFVDPIGVYIKIARQAGKIEVLTLLFKFLIIYYVTFFKKPPMAAIAFPKGEQAKTDIDRIKKSIQVLRLRWGLEDRENNAATIRAYRNHKLTCEMFRFSLAPTTDNESKTLNVLAVEESHKADHQKRRDQLDSMLASTGGPTWHFGVGCPVVSDYLKGCKGLLPGIAIVIDAEEVSRDRREVYEKTGDPSHLAYERKFRQDVRKYGRNNPEIRRNYHVEEPSRKVTSSAGNDSWSTPGPRESSSLIAFSSPDLTGPADRKIRGEPQSMSKTTSSTGSK